MSSSPAHKKLFINLIAIGSVAILFTVLIHIYVKNEHFIYFWDYSTYYNKYLYFGESIGHSPIFNRILNSVRYEDYNLLAVLPLIIPRMVLGFSRFGYIESVFLLYLLPSIILLAYLLKVIIKSFYNKNVKYLSIFLIIISVPPVFWGSMLRGYVDVVVTIPMVLLVLIGLKIIHGGAGLKECIYMGMLLFLGCLLRRWFLIWSVAYITSLMGTLFLYLIYDRGVQRKAFSKRIIFIFISLFIFLIASLIFKPLFVTQIGIGIGFLDSLSSYKGTFGIVYKIVEQIHTVGLFYVLLSLAGLVFGILKKQSRYFFLFLFFIMVTSFLIFINIQNLSGHHSYLYLPILIILTAFGTYRIVSDMGVKKRLFLIFSVTAMSIVCNYKVFVPPPFLRAENLLIPSINYYPLIRRDISEIDSLAKKINILAGNTHNLIYVLSSSSVLNDDIFQNRAYELGYVLNVLNTSQVDSRDGFPKNFFSSQYIITTEPVGYHLDPCEQRSIGLPYNFLVNQEQYFKKISNCYQLEDKTCAFVYQKIKDVPDPIIRSMENEFASD